MAKFDIKEVEDILPLPDDRYDRYEDYQDYIDDALAEMYDY